MISVRHSLGQYAPNPYGGQPQPSYGYVDPLVDAGLYAAGQALAPGDPQAPVTFQLVRRIMLAPPFPGGSGTPAGGRKVSDLNPALSTIAWVKENQALSLLLVLSVPVGAFLLGRSTRR